MDLKQELMDLKQELIDRLGVPENWDKYDYELQRYSFDDMQEVLEDIVKKLTISDFVGQSEQLLCECEVPIIRTGWNDSEYCGLCGKDIC